MFFIIFLSFYTKAQSNETNKPVLANSESLLIDSLPNKGHDNSPKLSMQESKLDNKTEHVTQKANLEVSETAKREAIKAVIHPKK